MNPNMTLREASEARIKEAFANDPSMWVLHQLGTKYQIMDYPVWAELSDAVRANRLRDLRTEFENETGTLIETHMESASHRPPFAVSYTMEEK